MATSWLDLMAEDSNISLASSHDAEFDNSRQGVNLLFKRNVKIISDDSQSRKRTFKQMTSNDDRVNNSNNNNNKNNNRADKENMDCNGKQDENDNCLPPKAKQRTNAEGGWKKRKNDSEGRKTLQNENGNIGFQRFLNWASPKSAILGTKLNDNNRNIGNKTQTSNNLVVCAAPSMTTRRRKQYRAKRSTLSKTPSESNTIHHCKENEIAVAVQATALQKEEAKPEQQAAAAAQVEDKAEDEGERDVEMSEPHVDEAVVMTPSPITTECAKLETPATGLSVKQEAEKPISEPPAASTTTPSPTPPPPQNALRIEVKIDEEEEEEEDQEHDDEDDEDEDEDDDLKTPIQRFKESKKRRITPTLDNVILNTDLIMNKVPILKKNASGQCSEGLAGPILLNADQYVAKMRESTAEKTSRRQSIDHEEEEEEEAEQDADGDADEEEKQTEASGEEAKKAEEFNFEENEYDIWGNKTKEKAEAGRQCGTWASKLFGDVIAKNKQLREKQERELVQQRKRERLQEMKIESILPASQHMEMEKEKEKEEENGKEKEKEKEKEKSFMFSRESSISVPMSVSATSITVTSDGKESGKAMVSTPVVPSTDATEWREKQIVLGKETIGYKNYIAKYPNKDMLFRINNNLLSTPDPKEKIGKKRWVGKYQKWRKFLHQFDSDEHKRDATNADL